MKLPSVFDAIHRCCTLSTSSAKLFNRFRTVEHPGQILMNVSHSQSPRPCVEDRATLWNSKKKGRIRNEDTEHAVGLKPGEFGKMKNMAGGPAESSVVNGSPVAAKDGKLELAVSIWCLLSQICVMAPLPIV